MTPETNDLKCSLRSKLYCPFLGKGRPRNLSRSTSKRVLPGRKMGRAQKMKRGGGGNQKENACIKALWISNTPFASERSSWLAGLVEQYWHLSIKGQEGSKVLTFLTERVLSRELRQYGRNPAVQCRRFGISTPMTITTDTIATQFAAAPLILTSLSWMPHAPRTALLRGKTEWFCLVCFIACLWILWHFIRSIFVKRIQNLWV